MAKYLKIVFVFVLVLISFEFFEARFLPKTVNLYLRFLYITAAIVLSLPFFFRKRKGFVLPVQLMILSMVISIFMAYVTWGQSIFKTVLATVPYMLWIFFFYLLAIKIPIKTIEFITAICAIIYSILYFYQFTHTGTPLFGSYDEFAEDRGIIRIIFPGGGVLFLASFMAINKLTTQKDKRWLWITIAFLGVICTVLQVTRQSIFALFLIYFYHFIKDLNIIQKTICISLFVGTFLLIVYTDNPIMNNKVAKGIQQQQKENSSEGKKYIRVVAANYFLTDFAPDNMTRILGNGVPYALETYYALYLYRLQQEGFFLSDIGIIAMYVMFGILSVIAYLMIWVKSFALRIKKEYYYAKYYLWYLLITSVTSDFDYSLNYLMATVFALYIFQSVYEEERESHEPAVIQALA